MLVSYHEIEKEVLVRDVLEDDLPQLIGLCAQHAAYENANYDLRGKQEALKVHFFSKTPTLYAYVAEKDGELIGYTTVTKEFSTWDAAYFAYMDCLFVQESARGVAVGMMLMRAVKHCATQLFCTEIQWQTPKENVGAIRFYRRQGATVKPKERFFLKR